MSAASRQLFVTTALPYANGNFHIGHIMEYIQADTWVRTMRMMGHEVPKNNGKLKADILFLILTILMICILIYLTELK